MILKSKKRLHAVLIYYFLTSDPRYFIKGLGSDYPANPVSGKWHLVDDYTDYEHSSASFYELNKQSTFDIVHYKDVRG